MLHTGDASAARLQVPLVQVCGHNRAVSYVRWMGANRLVSASTDNCLKLWDVAAATRAGAAPAPLTTFTGTARALGISKGDWQSTCYCHLLVCKRQHLGHAGGMM